MSRVAKSPINVPSGVEFKVSGQNVSVKGPKGALNLTIHNLVNAKITENVVSVASNSKAQSAVALAGTTRSLLNNMVTGVSTGFSKKLQLVGVGYRAKAAGKKLNLTLGFSHPVDFAVPEGITIETPSQTDITISGIDKQLVGQVAANIRAYRPPEPYKGKGVRYANEHIVRKEAKKK